MMEMIQIWVKILEPVLIHFIAINIVQMIGLHADAAFLTTMAAVMVLPFFCYMMKKDGYFQKKRKILSFGKVTGGIVWQQSCSAVDRNRNHRANYGRSLV